MTAPSIRRAQVADVPSLAPLFDAYRRFYAEAGDIERACAYLHARLERGEAIVLIADAGRRAAPASDASNTSKASNASNASVDGTALGFCLLYPTWCSVAAAPICVLSDLFVVDAARRTGTGRALMQAACEAGRTAGAVRLDLMTAHANTRAQALYESLGWQRDAVFRTYSLSL